MDKLRPFGTIIDDVLLPTFGVYAPFILAKEAEIRSTRRETHQYGFAPRQQLDIYYPDKEPVAPFSAKPVLVFLYGGGFVSGNKVNQDFAHGLVFGNLGHFFASRYGFTVIVADYRLLAHGAKYPSGGEDVKLVVEWIKGTLSQKPGYESIDLFLMGNSAGGIHVTTYLVDPGFKESKDSVMAEGRTGPGVLLRGVILLGVPYHWGREDNAVLRAYTGDGMVYENSVMGVLKRQKQKGAEPTLPGAKIYMLVCELDPDFIISSSIEFRDEWKSVDIKREMLDSHNHISPQLGLGTGIEREEAWGVQVAEFVKSGASK
ncbi:alpha/beta-hydrolase [Hypoxylon sp. FL1284]|nr:alpha/beta-hydrolase [Hypoxylon sp. FL1284]